MSVRKADNDALIQTSTTLNVARLFTFPNMRKRHPWLFSAMGRAARAVLVLAFLGLLTAPYLLIRGWGDETSMPRSDAWILPIERLLGFGATPTERLQALHGGGFGPFEVACLVFYASFFYLPPVIMVATAYVSMRRFWWLLAMYLLLLYVAGPLFVLFPTEPPWMAVGEVERVLTLWKPAPLDADTNTVAAFPSLHVAMPAAFMFWARNERIGWLVPLLVLQTLGVSFAVVYLGEHYVIDVFAGVLLAYAVARLAREKSVSRIRALGYRLLNIRTLRIGSKVKESVDTLMSRT